MRARQTFDQAIDAVASAVGPDEGFLAWYAGEDSHFVRFNGGRVRQPGAVSQHELTVRLVQGAVPSAAVDGPTQPEGPVRADGLGVRHVGTTLTLGGGDDRGRIQDAVLRLRGRLAHVAPDPHFLARADGPSTAAELASDSPDLADVIEQICRYADGVDLVGIYSAGPLMRGFASSTGRRDWFCRGSHQLDFSVVYDADRAAKVQVASERWDPAAVQAGIERGRAALPLLALPVQQVPPGEYRTWLAPAAVNALLEIVAWGGFSARAKRGCVSPLQRLYEGKATLSPAVTLTEDLSGGLAAPFQSLGFRRVSVPLVCEGRGQDLLVSPRGAVETGQPTNGADASEQPVALRMAPGDLDQGDALGRLDRGVLASNLWYLNFSDRAACAVTGMTRFASFWVEDGQIKGPLAPLRFDDTLYRMLGAQLEALGAEAQLQPSADTYFRRSSDSSRVPGALLKGLRYTL